MKLPRTNKKSKRRRPVRRLNDYGHLEPRQMLAATGHAQFDGDTSLGQNIISNGTFETVNVAADNNVLMDSSQVQGWNTVGAGADAKIRLRKLTDSPRGVMLELDTTSGRLDHVSQTISTETDQQYTLAFDLRGRSVDSSAHASTNEVIVIWNGQEIGSFRGIHFWQTFVFTVTGGSGNSTNLEFKEVSGDANDGIGPLIDNVRLVKVNSQALENGSFENLESGSTVGTVDSTKVPGWNAHGSAENRMLDIRSSSASQGSNFLNLDSSDSRLDRLYRDVATENGAKYFLSFDLRSSSGEQSQSEEIRIRWNGEWVGTFRGDSQWQSFGMTLTANSESTRLVLREPPVGNTQAGDGSGPFLDNVKIVKIDTSVAPASSVDVGSTTQFTLDEDSTATSIAPDTTISSSQDIISATVQIANNADRQSETLAVNVSGTTITQSYNASTGTLSLSGRASAAEYASVIQQLTYHNSSQNPSDQQRKISITVTTDSGTSDPADIMVAMTPINDAPIISAIADTVASVGDELKVTVSASDPESDSITYSANFKSGIVQSNDNFPIVDSQGELTWTPSRAGTFELRVMAKDPSQLTTESIFTVVVSLEVATAASASGQTLPDYAEPDTAVGMDAPTFQTQTFDGTTKSFTADGTGRLYGFMAHW